MKSSHMHGKYEIFCAQDISTLESYVNEALEEDARLAGGVAVDPGGKCLSMYFQAVWTPAVSVQTEPEQK